MNPTSFKLYCIVLSLFMSCSYKPRERSISVEELSSWPTYGIGEVALEGNEIILTETQGSDGFFLISPNKLAKDLVIRYQVKPMSESSVLITLFSATQTGTNEQLALPPVDATPMEVWQWRSKMKHYNLTFNNSSHGNNPFFFKNLNPNKRGFHQWLSENIATAGEWHDVEIGRENNNVWFKLNGITYFEIAECDPLAEGHLLLRISGTSGDSPIFAKAAFRNLIISY